VEYTLREMDGLGYLEGTEETNGVGVDVDQD
jgi:hypothetical protein